MELKRLDYGDTASLSLWNIMELTPDIAVLPLQTVQVSLANVGGFLFILYQYKLNDFHGVCKVVKRDATARP